MFSPSASYAQRRHEIYRLVQPKPIGLGDNAFNRVAGDDDEDEVLMYKLDHYMRAKKADSPAGQVGMDKDKSTRDKITKALVGKNDFKRLGQLGDGQFGRVTAVMCKFNSAVYAMKSVKKHTAQRAGVHLNMAIERKIHIMARKADCSFVPFAVAAFQDEREVHLVCEYAPYGSLWDVMWNVKDRQAGRLEDNEIRWWAVQMALPIQWLHDQGYIHRDIKPHNFLVFPGSRLKLTDFGTAARQADEHRLREVSAYYQPLPLDQCLIAVGTPDYIAPEVLEMAEDATVHEISRQKVPDAKKLFDPLADRNLEGLPGYGTGADWWSYGVTLYELVYGTAPFLTPTVRETYERILRCAAANFPPMYRVDVNPHLNSLLKGLLVHHKRRLGTFAGGPLAKHPFFAPVNWEELRAGRYGFIDAPAVPLIAVNRKLPAFTEFDADDLDFDGDWTMSDPEPSWEDIFDSSVLTRTISTVSNASMPSLKTLSTVHTAHAIVADMSAERSGPMNDLRTDRWYGWTWLPPPAIFEEGEQHQRTLIRHGDLTMLSSNTSFAAFSFATPAKQGSHKNLPATPRSTKRFRDCTDRRVAKDLVSTVVESAKRKCKEETKATRVSIPGQTPFNFKTMSKGALDDFTASSAGVVDQLKGKTIGEKLDYLDNKHSKLDRGYSALAKQIGKLKLQNEGGYVSLNELKEEDEEEETANTAPSSHVYDQLAPGRPDRSDESDRPVQQRIRQLSFQSALSIPRDSGPHSRQTSLASIRSRTTTGGTNRSDVSAETATQQRATRVRHPYHVPDRVEGRKSFENTNPFDTSTSGKAAANTRKDHGSDKAGRSVFGPKKSLDAINPFRTKKDPFADPLSTSPSSSTTTTTTPKAEPTAPAPAAGAGGQRDWRSRTEDPNWKGPHGDVFSM